MAFAGIAMSLATSSLPAAPSRSSAVATNNSATTPGVSPRLTAVDSCCDSAALPASENFGATILAEVSPPATTERRQE